jgi:CBS domain-containing protein
MRVDDLMTKDVFTVTPATTLKEVASLLVQKGISGLPVVDGDQLVGVISEADLLVKEASPAPRPPRALEWLLYPDLTGHAEKLEARTAGEAMTAPAITIEPYASVATAAAKMTEEGLNRLPVLKDGKLVGIVTRADVVRAFARSDEEIKREIREDVVERGFWEEPDAVDISVSDGDVVLSGTVQSNVVADGLPHAVERVPGVVSVDSKLTVVEREGR